MPGMMPAMRGMLLAFGLFALLAGQAVMATERGPHYFLPKVTSIKVFTEDPRVDWLFGGGLLYGYGITPHFSAEADFNYGGIGGDYTSGAETGQYEIWTLGLYAAGRQPLGKRAYAKLKAGVLFESLQKNNDVQPSDYQGLSLTAGLGAGFVYGRLLGARLTLEAEYVQLERDLGAITAAANLAF